MIQIDILGPQGNAYALIGLACRIGKEMQLPQADIDAITKKMMAGDYNHLLDTLLKSFPHIYFEFDNDPRSAE